jgi:hypothetical protein
MRDDLRAELEHGTGEPFLPAEKRLVGWSLALGAVLLGVLVWLSNAFFAP